MITLEWLEANGSPEGGHPVEIKRTKYVEFCAYIYRIDRGDDLPSLWYVWEKDSRAIKEICNY